MKCDEIQAVLLDYMTRELGGARAGLVREHLRKCESCRRTAADMQATLDLLRHAGGADAGVPDHLSDARRARLRLAFMHPILDWVYRHHIAVSIAVALAAVALLVGRACRMEVWEAMQSGVTVTVDNGPPPGKATNRLPRLRRGVALRPARRTGGETNAPAAP